MICGNGRKRPGNQDALDELLEMRETAQAVHDQWKHELREGHASLQTSFDELVRNAARIRDFQMTLIPGLLQTPDYARYRALEAVRVHGTAADKVDEMVAARMRRQEVLYASGKQFEFLVLEAAFRYLLCPAGMLWRGSLTGSRR
jgi:predicted butyrate kinase (DUF1464 family)